MKIFKQFFIILIIVLVFINAFPFFTGTLVTAPVKWGNLNVSSFVKIPNYYYQLNDYLKNDSEDYRIASLPIATWNMYTFDWEYGYLGIDFEKYFFEKSVIFALPHHHVKSGKLLNNGLDKPGKGLNKLLGLLNIKYIILHHDVDTVKGNYHGELRPVEKLEKILNESEIYPVKNFGKITLYRTPDNFFLPHIYSSFKPRFVKGDISQLNDRLSSNESINNNLFFLSKQVKEDQLIQIQHKTENSIVESSDDMESNYPALTFKRINPTKYIISVQSCSRPFFLVFSETFDRRWKIYINNSKTDLGNVIASYDNINVKETAHKMDFRPLDIKYLFAKSYNEKYHFKANGYANSWFIDVNQVCKVESNKVKSFCHKNPDGSYDFEMIVEFWPQRLFYLGLFISLTTLLTCLSYLTYDYIKRRKSGAGPSGFQGKPEGAGPKDFSTRP